MAVDNESGRPNKGLLPRSFPFLFMTSKSTAILFPLTLAVIMEKRQATSITWERKSNIVFTTLGNVFARQYASEIWAHYEKLDADAFPENVRPLFKKAVYSGLSRPINDVSSG